MENYDPDYVARKSAEAVRQAATAYARDKANERQRGDMRSRELSEAYERGLNSAVAQSKQREDRYMRAFADKLMTHVTRGLIAPDEQRSTPGTWPRFLNVGSRYGGSRAAEHIVYDGTNAATPNAAWDIGSVANDEIATAFVDAWSLEAMPAAQYATLVEQTGSGVPNLPIMATAPTAGPQVGEKLAVYSAAFDIANNDAATEVNATLHLNISELIDVFGGRSIVEALMRAAVMSEANSQIVAAMTAAGTTAADIGAGFGAFNGGRYQPQYVIVPPSEIFNVNATTLQAVGVTTVIDASATQTLVVSKSAVIGWFREIMVENIEPSAFGYGKAVGVFGRVSVDPAGVQVVAATP